MAPDGEGSAPAGEKKQEDPRDIELAALRKAKTDFEATAKKAQDEFEAFKTEQARAKMNEQEKLAADKAAAEKKAEKAEKEAAKAKKEAEKAYFGAEMISYGLKSVKFVDTVIAERIEGEDAKALATRLKAQDEFSGLFGGASRGTPVKAPPVPGGSLPKGGEPSVADEDEDDKAFANAFPKDPAARKAAKDRLAKQRAANNNAGATSKKKRA